MLHHASFAISDLERSTAFYDSALSALGYVRVWADKTHALGMTAQGQIVSRQKFISGVPPLQDVVDNFLSNSGLIPVKRSRWLWKISAPDQESEIWVGDARSDNFVLTPERIVPIDIRLWNVVK